MEKENLLCSRIDAKNRRLKTYLPTQKAHDLEPILRALAEWGSKYN